MIKRKGEKRKKSLNFRQNSVSKYCKFLTLKNWWRKIRSEGSNRDRVGFSWNLTTREIPASYLAVIAVRRGKARKTKRGGERKDRWRKVGEKAGRRGLKCALSGEGGCEEGGGVRRTGWWISRGDLSREISPASSRGRQLPWCRPRDDGSLPVTEPFITSIYQPPLHLALESEHSTAIYSLRIVINVDRSVPCYSTSLPSPFLLRSLSPPSLSSSLLFHDVRPHVSGRWLGIDYARSSSRSSDSSLETA